MMDTDKILLHFNILLRQNVTHFFQNPLIHQKHQNDVLCGNVHMDVSPKSGNHPIDHTLNFSASISHTCRKAIKQTEPLSGVP